MVSKGETLNEANLNEEKICDKANMEEEDVIDSEKTMTSKEKIEAILSCSSANQLTSTYSQSSLPEYTLMFFSQV